MTVTNTSLLRRVRDTADAESWREFYMVYEPLLLTYVRSKHLQESDARDVVADVFVKLYHTMPSFQLDHGVGRFRTWLWRVTMNAVADWARRQDKAKEMPSDLDVADPQPGPDDPWDKEYLKAILQAAVVQIRQQVCERHPKTWACYEQHILRGRPAADVARELDFTANNVYAHASRVQKKIREVCRQRYEEEIGGGGDDVEEYDGEGEGAAS